MLTVTIPITFQVPDDCESAAIDLSGRICAFAHDANPMTVSSEWRPRRGFMRCIENPVILNWKKTLTKVEDAKD